MASIRITQFGGLSPGVSPKLKQVTDASIAHNCLLTDGRLRPQAKWVRQAYYLGGAEPVVRSIAYDPVADSATMYTSNDVVLSPGEPFPARMAYGATLTPPVSRHVTNQGFAKDTVAIYDVGLSGTVTYERAYLSDKPVNRVYAVSRVRKTNARIEEGALTALIGDPSALVYEGDTATLNVNVAVLDDKATHIRIYRSISGLDSGEAVSNDLDTEWHLIAEVPIAGVALAIFIDGGSVTTDPLDVNFSGQFHPPELIARHFGLTESGWFTAVSDSGEIAFSERYMPHAWPSDRLLNIQERITDIAVRGDNVFIGTEGAPYIVSVSQGDKGIQLAAVRYTEEYRCIPGTMTPSANGAIYASPAGLVSISRDGIQLITAGLVNPGDKFFRRDVSEEESRTEEAYTLFAGIGYTANGIYYQGKYYGFCGGLRNDIFYLTSTPYPFYYWDGMSPGFSITDSVLDRQRQEYGIPPEAVALEFTIEDLVLRPLRRDIDGGLDAVHFTDFTLLEAELRTIRRDIDGGTDGVTASIELISINLDTIRIDYEQAPENMTCSFAITEVSLI